VVLKKNSSPQWPTDFYDTQAAHAFPFLYAQATHVFLTFWCSLCMVSTTG